MSFFESPVVAAVSLALASSLIVWRLRTLSCQPVLKALHDPDPELRKAAVVLATRHGLSRYRRSLVRLSRTEKVDCVLLTLAEAIDRAGRGRRRPVRPKKLWRWANVFFAMRELLESDDRAPAPPAGSAAPGIDALEAVETASAGDGEGPAGVTAAPTHALAATRKWRAAAGELDALQVVNAVAAKRSRRQTRRPVDQPGGQDIETLLDELIGQERRAATAPGPGSSARSAS